MDTNSTIVPRLAAVPVRPAQPTRVLGRIVHRAVDRFVPPEMVVAHDWFKTVDSANTDHRLPNQHFGVWSEQSDKRLFTGELTNPSRRVLQRLQFLINEVGKALETEEGSIVIDGLAQTMQQIATPLLWDAALDLRLADNSLAEVSYRSGSRSVVLVTARSWVDAPPGAIELRARVLYAIEALGLIYGSVIERQIEIRLNGESFASAQLEDALNWFKCYAEVHAEANAALELPAPTPRWQFWKQA